MAPRPAGGSPPIQLPIAPLPKSALNNAGDKKTTSDAAASAKAIQVLLPKSPLPPTSTRKFFSEGLGFGVIAKEKGVYGKLNRDFPSFFALIFGIFDDFSKL